MYAAIPLLPTLGVPELMIILTIVIIFFGVGKLPEIGDALGIPTFTAASRHRLGLDRLRTLLEEKR